MSPSYKHLLIVLVCCIGKVHFSYAQDTLQQIYPDYELFPDLDLKLEKELERERTLLEKTELTQSEQQELDLLFAKNGEVRLSVWDVIDGGCSWYCGGGNYAVSTSSLLKAEKDFIYDAEQANDLNYKTAWVEGKEGPGIGEYLEYRFKNNSPRITTIIISNGYVKSENTWNNNNRVKLLKLFVNDKAMGVIHLSDTRADQIFKVGVLGHNSDGSDLILRFEILDIYKGVKFDDTAITEIYFDGIDVH